MQQQRRIGGRSWPLLVVAAIVATVLGLGIAQSDSAEAIGEPIVFTEVNLAGADASVTITNTGADAIDVSGWFVCNFPAYWPIPAGTTVDAGASLVIHAGDGTDSASEIYAGGGFGALSGGAAGEVAIYNAQNFASAEAIVAYVGWDGGGQRKSVAQDAALWGADDVTTAAGDVITRVGDGTDAASYGIVSQEEPPVEEPVAAAAAYGAQLSGDAQPTPVETDAWGGFSLEVAGGVATYQLAVVNIDAASQAHIHQGPAGSNGGVIAFLALNDPAVSGDWVVEGTIRTEDLIGSLAGDWDGFLAGLASGGLYVNVHTAANPGGELRGQIGDGVDGGVSAGIDVPAGSSQVGWFGLATDSATLLANTPSLSVVWWLSPSGWIADSPQLPGPLRNNIAIEAGTGILVVTTAATTIEVPLVTSGGALTAAIAGVDGSGVSGVASFAAYGDGVRVRMAVQGLPEGDHANHVHHGSCAMQGEVHVPLSELGADASLNAEAATVWADNDLDHFATGHYVAIHELSSAGGVGPVIACGDVG